MRKKKINITKKILINLIKKGKTYEGIAEELNICVNTVSTYLKKYKLSLNSERKKRRKRRREELVSEIKKLVKQKKPIKKIAKILNITKEYVYLLIKKKEIKIEKTEKELRLQANKNIIRNLVKKGKSRTVIRKKMGIARHDVDSYLRQEKLKIKKKRKKEKYNPKNRLQFSYTSLYPNFLDAKYILECITKESNEIIINKYFKRRIRSLV